MLEWAVPEQPRVGDAIQRDATGKAQIARRYATVKIASFLEKNLLEQYLKAPRHVPVKLGQFGFGHSRLATEKGAQALRMHLLGILEVEVFQIQAILAALRDVDERANLVEIP